MCRPVVCKQCALTTWAGCGLHVDDVMRDVPVDLRCPGHEGDDAPTTATLTPGRGLLAWLKRS